MRSVQDLVVFVAVLTATLLVSGCGSLGRLSTGSDSSTVEGQTVGSLGGLDVVEAEGAGAFRQFRAFGFHGFMAVPEVGFVHHYRPARRSDSATIIGCLSNARVIVEELSVADSDLKEVLAIPEQLRGIDRSVRTLVSLRTELRQEKTQRSPNTTRITQLDAAIAAIEDPVNGSLPKAQAALSKVLATPGVFVLRANLQASGGLNASATQAFSASAGGDASESLLVIVAGLRTSRLALNPDDPSSSTRFQAKAPNETLGALNEFVNTATFLVKTQGFTVVRESQFATALSVRAAPQELAKDDFAAFRTIELSLGAGIASLNSVSSRLAGGQYSVRNMSAVCDKGFVKDDDSALKQFVGDKWRSLYGVFMPISQLTSFAKASGGAALPPLATRD